MVLAVNSVKYCNCQFALHNVMGSQFNNLHIMSTLQPVNGPFTFDIELMRSNA